MTVEEEKRVTKLKRNIHERQKDKRKNHMYKLISKFKKVNFLQKVKNK